MTVSSYHARKNDCAAYKGKSFQLWGRNRLADGGMRMSHSNVVFWKFWKWRFCSSEKLRGQRWMGREVGCLSDCQDLVVSHSFWDGWVDHRLCFQVHPCLNMCFQCWDYHTLWVVSLTQADGLSSSMPIFYPLQNSAEICAMFDSSLTFLLIREHITESQGTPHPCPW
jgi:hypothetical protein